MNTNDLILKMAGQKVSEALKGAEMIKEVPAQTMSVIQDEIDPETVAVIERLLGGKMEKSAKIKIVDKTKRFDPITDTIGQLGRVSNAVASLSTDPFLDFNDENKEKLFSIVKDFESKYPELDGLTVNIGDTPNAIESITEMATGKGTLLDKFFRTTSILPNTFAKFFRADNYDPRTNSVNVFSPSEAFLRHELGHAVDNARIYGGSRVLQSLPRSITQSVVGNLGVIDPLSVLQEAVATGTGAKSLHNASEDEKRKYSRTTGAALGGYTGSALGTILSGIYGRGNGVLNRIRNAAPIVVPAATAAGTLLGGLIGHLKGNAEWLPGHDPTINTEK